MFENKILPNLDYQSGSKTLSIGFSIVISIVVAFLCEFEFRSLNQMEAIVATIIAAIISYFSAEKWPLVAKVAPAMLVLSYLIVAGINLLTN